jgi:hypothetical protein
MERLGVKDDSGQALMEFILSMIFAMSFFFFFLKMSAAFAIANYVHYATFMAARAYSASAPTLSDQQARGEAVLSKMVKGRFKGLLQASGAGIYVGEGPYFDEGPQNHWNQGATYSFKVKLSLYPWSMNRDSILMDLTSESWMPRSVSVKECLDMKKQISIPPDAVQEWDNGDNGC